MGIFDKLTQYVQRVFKTSLETFFEALKLSSNARGYVLGSITELLLKQKLENEFGCEVRRIREKWSGRKHPKHRGDFYFRKPPATGWFVLESKGVKSNSEKWHKLYNYTNLKAFLCAHVDRISWVAPGAETEAQVISWIERHLPRFKTDYAINLYEFEEVQSYNSKRENEKFRAIAALKAFSREQIEGMVEERLAYVMAKVKVLETHFVSGFSDASERTQATPRRDEFNIVAVDIALRYPAHKFLFANPKNLESSGADANHLQQNYIIGFVFTEEGDARQLNIAEEWTENFAEALETLKPKDAVDDKDMQIDSRNLAVDDED